MTKMSEHTLLNLLSFCPPKINQIVKTLLCRWTRKKYRLVSSGDTILNCCSCHFVSETFMNILRYKFNLLLLLQVFLTILLKFSPRCLVSSRLCCIFKLYFDTCHKYIDFYRFWLGFSGKGLHCKYSGHNPQTNDTSPNNNDYFAHVLLSPGL